MEQDFSLVEKRIGIVFKNKDLLIQAFCHRSYINENSTFNQGHNERLEFLGDAVLELAVTDYLYLNYPDKAEGELTSWRAALVNTKTLSKKAKELKLGDFVLMSKGETKENGRARRSVLANTFEALIGAVYLDSGYNKCYKLIEKELIVELPKIIEEQLYRDPKSLLQEESQRRESVTPNYKLIKEWGPDHKKNFMVGVFLKDRLIAEGQGLSKQEAEESAAKKALEVKGW
jgi:ribonuclease III